MICYKVTHNRQPQKTTPSPTLDLPPFSGSQKSSFPEVKNQPNQSYLNYPNMLPNNGHKWGTSILLCLRDIRTHNFMCKNAVFFSILTLFCLYLRNYLSERPGVFGFQIPQQNLLISFISVWVVRAPWNEL